MDQAREQRIRERAYAIWESQGRPEGRHEEHWRLASEAESRNEYEPDIDPTSDGVLSGSPGTSHHSRSGGSGRDEDAPRDAPDTRIEMQTNDHGSEIRVLGEPGPWRRRDMRVSEAMTRDVRVACPDQTIQEVARVMLDLDTGVLPVGEIDRLVGMITDHDIAVRGVAEGRGPETAVREVMTPDVLYCFEEDDLHMVSRNMADQQVRRMPVVNRDKRLVGILSLGDMAIMQDTRTAAKALGGISEPGGEHSQSEEQSGEAGGSTA